jgi:hypothetical protein
MWNYRGLEKRLIELARKYREIVEKDQKVGVEEEPVKFNEGSQL